MWQEQNSRNQFIWVPVQNASSRIYEKNATTGKIKARIWNFSSTGRSVGYNTDDDTKAEVGVINKDVIDYMSDPNYGGMPGYSKDILYKELETEYKNTIKSIEKYGGFYIGRYETGNISSNIPVVKRMNSTISGVNWYKMYIKMRNISSNSNIQTSMIWGSLYDETLEWLIESGEKNRAEIAQDSSSWGNYCWTVFNYYKSEGNLGTKTSSQQIIPTGSA